MPWNLIVTGGALVLLLAAWLFRRRQPSSIGPMPNVGQPPEDAEPMVEPRLQDIGSATYELPLSPPDAEPDAAHNTESDRRPG
jgi:hypothetical protein